MTGRALLFFKTDYAFHTQVLSPIQTLLFAVDAHPSRPDALALTNSVAFKLGRAAEGCPKVGDICRQRCPPQFRCIGRCTPSRIRACMLLGGGGGGGHESSTFSDV